MSKQSTLTLQFTQPLLNWFDQHGRKDLPWQHPRTPYRIWVAEIMLQQTQVKTVIPYFARFMDRFPNLTALANASEDKVLALWSGLGYYSRARNLHQTAKIITQTYQGKWPNTVELLTTLPGIGRSTAAAIASQAFNQATAILDGNVKRVLCRYFMVAGQLNDKTVDHLLWNYAEQCMATERCADYTQAIMDMGATCCTRRNPQCQHCPLQRTCLAYNQNCTDTFPHKKTKKQRPTKSQQFLLIYNQTSQIYLEKRPPKGIWGSLWCLPTIEPDSDPKSYLKPFAQRASFIPDFIHFKHSFTHFHLQIQVTRCKIDAPATLNVQDHPGRWFTKDEIIHLGLPKPVQKIIEMGELSHIP